jgi:phosphonate transport system permease protein
MSRHAAILAADAAAGRRHAALATVVLAVALAALGVSGFFDAERFADAWPAVAQISSEMVPPDFSRWQSWLRPLADTLAMSIAGTALAVAFSLPLALLAAVNTAPNAVVQQLARLLLSFLRSVPEIIMGILFVAAVGFGALPGVLALGLHSVGMVGKFYAEAIEHTDPRPAEAARAVADHPARHPAAGAAAIGRYHALSLGVSFPRFGGAGYRRRGRHRL